MIYKFFKALEQEKEQLKPNIFTLATDDKQQYRKNLRCKKIIIPPPQRQSWKYLTAI